MEKRNFPSDIVVVVFAFYSIYFNEVRYSATYRITEGICGYYTMDTITFDVKQVFCDSSVQYSNYFIPDLIRLAKIIDDVVSPI
ncbi:MAG: hypothetical protein IT249_14095 [Chitinophagaceae bacterium]|nr:hypothetical protein [Chitinophagaceae bacterium]